MTAYVEEQSLDSAYPESRTVQGWLMHSHGQLKSKKVKTPRLMCLDRVVRMIDAAILRDDATPEDVVSLMHHPSMRGYARQLGLAFKVNSQPALNWGDYVPQGYGE